MHKRVSAKKKDIYIFTITGWPGVLAFEDLPCANCFALLLVYLSSDALFFVINANFRKKLNK
jgi:hypothetical protein